MLALTYSPETHPICIPITATLSLCGAGERCSRDTSWPWTSGAGEQQCPCVPFILCHTGPSQLPQTLPSLCPIHFCPLPTLSAQVPQVLPASLPALPARPGLLHPTRGCRAAGNVPLPSQRAAAMASRSFYSQTEKHIMGTGRLKTENERPLSTPASTAHWRVSLRGIKSISEAKIFPGLAVGGQ